MENAGYLPGINLHQHDPGLLCAFVHAVGGACWWICLTLYLSLLQDGTTALYFSSKNNHVEIVKLLLNSGAQVNKVQHCNVT